MATDLDVKSIGIDTARKIVSDTESDTAPADLPVGAPCEAVVTRWVGGMPQYNVGHHDKLETLTDELAALPGLHLTGAAYRGVGLAGCVADAATTATAVLAELHTPLSVKAGASG